jgi:pyruvate dehydrogenase E1 component alpha subunit
VEAVGQARSGGGPVVVEAETYRQGGHSRADPGTYRPAQEVAAWLERDPIPAYRAVLAKAGLAESELAAIDADVRAEVEVATEQAKAGAVPDVGLVARDVWADGGARWRN